MNMGQLKRMDQVRLIIETYLQTKSIKATSRRLKVARNTVKTYLRRAQRYNVELAVVLQLSEAELLSICYKPNRKEASTREKIFISKIDYWIKELTRIGVNKQKLWEEYISEYPQGYGYSQFCEKLKREIGRKDLTISLSHKPGEMHAD